MPVTFFKNDRGKLKNVTGQSGVANQMGWWNSLVAGDFDNDGDIDYITGNLGENSYFQASTKHPVNMYANDFDENGTLDAIISIYLKDEQGDKKEFTAFNRDDLVDQIPALKKKYLTYKEFGAANIHNIFPDSSLKKSLHLQANNFQTSYIQNLGNGKFKMQALPALAQMAPVMAMIAEDINNDGSLDIILCGNDFGNEVLNGRYDAMNGLVLLGNGKGNFTSQTIMQSGIYIPGNARALIKFRGGGNRYLIAASQNVGPLELFSLNNAYKQFIPLHANDKTILLHLKNGATRKEEVYHGNSYLSQSALFIPVNDAISSVDIINNKDEKRTINVQ